MKKFLVMVCSASVLFMVGCSGDKVNPEDVGKQYMEKRLVGADANLTNLTYTVKDAGNDMAIVSIQGTLTYKEQISLQKIDGEWVVVETPAEEEPVVLLEEQKAVILVAEEKAAALLEAEKAALLEGEKAALLEAADTADLEDGENTADLSDGESAGDVSEDEITADLEDGEIEADISEEGALPEDAFESEADSVSEVDDAPVADHAPATEIAHDVPEADHAPVEEGVHH